MLSTPTSARASLVVWHITDSALPTGAFSHSAGLETAVQAGEVADAGSFLTWLRGYLRQATYGEALAVVLARRVGGVDKLASLDELCFSTQTASEQRAAMSAMGKRMAKVARIIEPDDPLVAEYDTGLRERRYKGNPGIAAGLVLRAAGVDERTAAAAYLMQMASSTTQNAIRAIPLGQDAGQRIIVQMYSDLPQLAELTCSRGEEDLGVSFPRLEIAQMEHEYLRSRMFMS